MRRLFAVLLAANLIAIAWAATQLPDRVAVHWGVGNTPDNYDSRPGFLTFLVVFVVGMAVFFAGLAEWLARSMPMSLLNLPTKQRWIDAGQEPLLRRMLSEDLYLMAAATLGLFLALIPLTVDANRRTPPILSQWSWAILGAYVFVVLGWAAWITVVKYRRPPTL